MQKGGEGCVGEGGGADRTLRRGEGLVISTRIIYLG